MAAYGELVDEERIATITRASSWNNSGPAPPVISNLWNSANSRFLKRCCHERPLHSAFANTAEEAIAAQDALDAQP